MTNRLPAPEIRSAAFTAAREKCALSVEKLASQACLSKKQIQQIENGQNDAFYSPSIKLIAAKKVAKLIQLDEKDAFDFGCEAVLPLVPVITLESEDSGANNAHEIASPKETPAQPKVNQSVVAITEKKAMASSVTVVMKQDTDKQVYPAKLNQKSPTKKWVWLLPVGALALALLQFQPILQDQLDAAMGKQKPVELLAVPSAPPAESAPTNPSVVEANAIPASAVLPLPPVAQIPSPVVAGINSGCPPGEGAIETYKPASAGKPGNMIFVRANAPQTLCVLDADGIAQSKNMEVGMGHSFYGRPPFKLLSSAALSSAEVFFQGFRMRPNAADTKGMLLVQAD